MKLCLIYNYAPHYRSSIFKLLSETFDCDFLFGDSMSDVKKMDYSILCGKVTETHTIRIIGGWYWQEDVVRQLFKDYDNYILLGETRAISTWLFCLLARLQKSKKKVYMWSHAWYGKETKLEKYIKKILFRLPNGGMFCYGDYARNLMIKEGFNSNKLYTIHNSLAYEKQIEVRKSLITTDVYYKHFGNENKNLFFIGRLTPIKKLDQILQAIAICRNRKRNYNVILIGDGEKTKELKTLTTNLGLENQVWFYGACYDEIELSLLIYNADLCVAPGNIGLTSIHSMVFGTPCITHNDFSHQMPEFEVIKEGITGSFFKRNDVNDLADCIDRWFMTKGNKRDEVRKSCMDIIDKEWNPHYQIEVFKQVLGQ